jgi:hypothetical protein
MERVFKSLGAYKEKNIETLILILLKWDEEFHVHTSALLVVKALLAHNIIRKNVRLLNNA